MIPNLDAKQGADIKRRKAREITSEAVRNRDPLSYLAAADLWKQVGEASTAKVCGSMAKLIALVESDTHVEIIVPK